MLDPAVIGADHYDTRRSGFKPFTVGMLDTNKGFIHVIDDFTLDILLGTLDTAPDFARYLLRKEQFFRSGSLLAAAGEEELLALYLQRIGSDGEHDFVFSKSKGPVLIDEGHWLRFQNHPDRRAQVDADEISYVWDALIDTFTKHLLDGTGIHFPSDSTLSHQEIGLRFLASESRVRRRALAKSLIAVLKRGSDHDRFLRVSKPTISGEPYYVFLSVKVPSFAKSYDEYRVVRRNLLEATCLVLRNDYPNAKDIVGIATEPYTSGEIRSEDLIYVDGRYWTPELAEQARNDKIRLNILTNTKRWRTKEQEYPRSASLAASKGRNRNRPCSCGSGKKYKKCHGDQS
jgi:SEC-C motif-containing protein